jgi:mono/diheme cytochrome c family protein
MRRFAIVFLCFVLAPAAVAQQTRRRAVGVRPAAPVVPPPAAGAPLAGLSAAQTGAFDAGRGTFNRDETAARGLGPVFIQQSCGECHSVPAIGGGGGNNRNVTRIARRVNGLFDPLTGLGGSLMMTFAPA